MDKQNEEAAPATGNNPLYQGASRTGAAGNPSEDSLKEAGDAAPMNTEGDKDDDLPEDLG